MRWIKLLILVFLAASCQLGDRQTVPIGSPTQKSSTNVMSVNGTQYSIGTCVLQAVSSGYFQVILYSTGVNVDASGIVDYSTSTGHSCGFNVPTTGANTGTFTLTPANTGYQDFDYVPPSSLSPNYDGSVSGTLTITAVGTELQVVANATFGAASVVVNYQGPAIEL
jgi:hypothetical protein